MAKPKPTPQQTEVTEGIDLSELMTASELNPALAGIYAELGGEGRERVVLYIYKILAESGKEPRIWQGSPDDYDLMSLAKRFGSGDYRIKIYSPGERGNVSIRVNQVVSIMLDPLEDARLESIRKGEPVAIPGQPAPVSYNPADIAKAVAEGIRAAMPPQPDPFAQLDKLAGIMRTMMPQQSGGGLRDALETGKMLLEFTRGAREDDAPSGATKPADLALNRGIMLVEKMVAKHLESQPVAGAVVDAIPAASVAERMSQEDLNALNEIKRHLRDLAAEAKKGTDAEKVAEFIYEDIPDNLIAEMATNPEWFKIISSNVPECQPYSEWFFKLREHLIAYAREDGLLTPDGHLRSNQGDGVTIQGAVTPTT